MSASCLISGPGAGVDGSGGDDVEARSLISAICQRLNHNTAFIHCSEMETGLHLSRKTVAKQQVTPPRIDVPRIGGNFGKFSRKRKAGKGDLFTYLL